MFLGRSSACSATLTFSGFRELLLLLCNRNESTRNVVTVADEARVAHIADVHFYRATLCVSTVFAVGRCLSVRLSRWCIVSRRLKISSNFFLGPIAPSLVFDWAPIPNSKGNPSAGTQNTRGWENFAIFDWNRRLSRKRYEMPWLYYTER